MSRQRLDSVNKSYTQRSISARLEAFFLDNVGLVVSNEQLKQVARDPITGNEPENWHQRLSELRTDRGYTILSQRDDRNLKNGEYCLEVVEKRENAKSRRAINKKIKEALLQAAPVCVFPGCGLREGDIDPVGGGTVRLQVDHKTAHDHDDSGLDELQNYQLLCGRHNVTKKNLWDDQTGKLNIRAILQFVPHTDKIVARDWLIRYFSGQNEKDI
ncbi:MAG: HNH endonuclease [Burkholderiales bacterium]|nr:HNH endonuclease [Burkholderiales bacterium]